MWPLGADWISPPLPARADFECLFFCDAVSKVLAWERVSGQMVC